MISTHLCFDIYLYRCRYVLELPPPPPSCLLYIPCEHATDQLAKAVWLSVYMYMCVCVCVCLGVVFVVCLGGVTTSLRPLSPWSRHEGDAEVRPGCLSLIRDSQTGGNQRIGMGICAMISDRIYFSKIIIISKCFKPNLINVGNAVRLCIIDIVVI